MPEPRLRTYVFLGQVTVVARVRAASVKDAIKRVFQRMANKGSADVVWVPMSDIKIVDINGSGGDEK